MVKVTSVKKLMIILVALLICATVVFAACTNGDFKPVSMPKAATPDSNGGSVVQYGEWLYYVNGYASDVSADNTYSDDVKDTPRIGSVVRIKLAELEKLFEISEDETITSSSARTEKIADYVRKHAETVVPKIYISNNSTSTYLTGIYIFGDRIYITTPNDQLTPGGNPRTSELNLMSFKLDGSDPKVHYTFTSNSAEIWLMEKSGKVVATYYMDSQLHTLDVSSGKDTLIKYKNADKYPKIETINNMSSIKWDVAGESVFFINSIGQICKLAIGATEYTVVVDNDTYEIDSDHIHSDNATTYAIQSVNNGEVYYTKNSKVESAIRLYWTDGSNGENIALNSNNTRAIGWKDGKVIVSYTEDSGYYGIALTTSADNLEKVTILEPEYNEESISIVKVEGDKLYYSADNVYYEINIQEMVDGEHAEDDYLGVPYAYSISSTGWAAADFVTDGDVHYVFSVSNGNISVVKFDVETKKNSEKSVTLTLLPVVEEEDE